MTISVRNALGYALTRPAGTNTLRNVIGYALTLPAADAVVKGGDVNLLASREQMLYQLVVKSNPKMASYAATDIAFSSVTAMNATIAPSGGSSLMPDTSAIVKAAGSGSMIGQQTVYYRRIDISKLFKGRTLTLKVPYAMGTTAITRAQALDFAAQQFGIRIPTDDVNFTSWSFPANNSLSIVGTSPCFKGTLIIRVERDKQLLSSVVGDRTFAGRSWPDAMIDVGDGTKPQGELLLYDIDYSSQKSVLNNLSSGTVPDVNTTGSLAAAMNAVPNNSGYAFGNQRCDTPPGILLARATRYTLPNAAIPEANSAQYNRCVVIENVDYPQYPSWWAGKIILHYNV